MKTTKLATAVVLALASTALFAGSALAQTPLSYSSGDLFLGIRATGGVGATQDILIDIGSAASFRDATAIITLNLGNLGQDLTDVFGASWNTRSDLVWGVFGTPGTTAVNGDNGKTLYATRLVEGGIRATPWNAGSNSTQGTVTGRMLSVEQAYAATAGVPNVSTTNSSVVLVQNTSDVNSYATYNTITGVNPGGIGFGYFNPTIEGQFGSDLDLFRLPVGFNVPGTYEGTFSVGSNATVSFNPVPEPSSFAMAGFGLALLWSNRRQRKAAKL